MALLWIEGFEGFGNTLNVAPAPIGIMSRKYAVIYNESAFRIKAGRTGYCLSLNSSTQYFQTANLTVDQTIIVGFALRLNTLPTGLASFLAFYADTFHGMNVRINSSGTLTVYNGGILLKTSVNSLVSGIWYYIEVKVFTDNIAGQYEVRVNGSNWVSDTGVNTKPGTNNYHTAIRLTGSDIDIDDLYLLDGSGSLNNNFLGDRRVEPLRPNAIGSASQWTPLAGDNYVNVDEVVLDEDTSYVETNVSTNKDLYGYEDLTTLSSIDGIQIVSEARMVSGIMDLHHVIKSGATEDDGDGNPLVTTSYVTKHRTVATNPDTTNKWTVSELNNAEFGVKAV